MRKTIIFFIFILISALFFSTRISAQAQTDDDFSSSSEQINSFTSEMIVQADALVEITETIRYDFSNLRRHGIFRTIPYTKKTSAGKTLFFDYIVLSVIDENNSPYPYTVKKNPTEMTIKIGDANELITGQHTYIIRYTAKGIIGYFDDHDELYWNVTGNNWPVSIRQAKASVTLPERVKLKETDVVCYVGPIGSTDQNCGRSVAENLAVFETQSALPAESGLTMAVKFPKNMVQFMPPTIKNELPDRLKQIIFLMLLFLWYVAYPLSLPIRWYRHGRDPQVDKPLTSWYDPPKTASGRFLTPEETGTLVDETADMKDVSAMIVYLAQKGYLTIKQKGEKDFLLVRSKQPVDDQQLPSFEKQFLEEIFRDTAEVNLKEGDFISLVRNLKNSLYQAVVAEGFFPKNPQSVRTFYTVIVILGLFTMNFPLVVLAFIFGKNMIRKTYLGARAGQMALSLKNFLSSQSRQLEYQAKNQMFFEKLLPYAIAFGVEKIWARRFADIEMTPPSWYEGDFSSGFNSLMLVTSLNISFSQLQQSATPTTSGSGFSGGFSGGGGGGGGGGSW